MALGQRDFFTFAVNYMGGVTPFPAIAKRYIKIIWMGNEPAIRWNYPIRASRQIIYSFLGLQATKHILVIDLYI